MPFLPRSSYHIDVLDGGLNTKNTDITCPPNMSPYLLNVEFSDLGAASMAPGCTAFCSALGSAGVDCLHTQYFGGTEYLVAAQSASVYQAASTASTWSVISGSTGVFTAAVDICARTVLDEVYMTNGYATPHRYDGTNFYTVGVSAYTGGATGAVATTGSAGSLSSGVYVYKISGQNGNGVESNAATLTTAITVAANGGVTITGIPSCFPASAGVTTRYLYRNTAGSSTEFYRVTALTAAQTSVVDIASDSALVTIAQDDNFPPAMCKYWWYHKGRMYAAGDPLYPYRLYYSEAGQPEVWPALNALEIGEGDGQEITGLAAMGNAVVVHKCSKNYAQQSIWLVYQPDSTQVSDSTNWYVTKSPSAHATASNKSIVFFDNLMAFMSNDGVYAFTGDDIARGPATSQIGQYAADSISENIDNQFGFIGSIGIVGGINWDDKLWFTTGIDNAIKMLSYDYTTASNPRGIGSWSRHTLSQTCGELSVFNGAMYCAGKTTGQVYKFGGNYDINGNESSVSYYTPKIAGRKEHWEQVKIWRNVYVTMSNVAGALTYLTAYDYDGNVYGNTTIATGTARTYSTVKIPIVDSSGNPIASRTIQLLWGSTGKTSFTTATSPWQIHRIEVEYLLRSRRI